MKIQFYFYKYHPLMHNILIEEDERILNMSHENTYDLFYCE